MYVGTLHWQIEQIVLAIPHDWHASFHRTTMSNSKPILLCTYSLPALRTRYDASVVVSSCTTCPTITHLPKGVLCFIGTFLDVQDINSLAQTTATIYQLLNYPLYHPALTNNTEERRCSFGGCERRPGHGSANFHQRRCHSLWEI